MVRTSATTTSVGGVADGEGLGACADEAGGAGVAAAEGFGDGGLGALVDVAADCPAIGAGAAGGATAGALASPAATTGAGDGVGAGVGGVEGAAEAVWASGAAAASEPAVAEGFCG